MYTSINTHTHITCNHHFMDYAKYLRPWLGKSKIFCLFMFVIGSFARINTTDRHFANKSIPILAYYVNHMYNLNETPHTGPDSNIISYKSITCERRGLET